MLFMKKLFLAISILLIFTTSDIFSQIKKSAYFSRDYTATDSSTDYLTVTVKQKRNRIIVEELKFDGKNWKSIDKKIYQPISDSIFINKKIKFNKNTILWNTYTPYKVIVVKTVNDNYYFKEYNFHNVLLREGNCKSYFPIIKHGEIKEYYSNGNISNIAKYENNSFVSSQRWMMNGSNSIDNVFTEVEILPKFNGKSIEAFYNKLSVNVHYPLNPNRKAYVDGICTVEFIIKNDGSITNMQFVENSDFPEIDLQVLQFIRNQKDSWSAAEISNKPVDYVMHINYGFQDTRGNW